MKTVTKDSLYHLTYRVVGAAIEVHKILGPGLLESVYHKCLKQEFFLRGIPYSSNQYVGVDYKGIELDTELRCDLFVDSILAVELKAVDTVIPVHEAQILTYMKLLKAPKGILINFNSYNLFKDGQKTYVNELFEQLT
ncbi:MAG: GxxExxY protein [Bacteroidia bacterium]|nr:GxxExxY protein [Bacteroidia bacterium]